MIGVQRPGPELAEDVRGLAEADGVRVLVTRSVYRRTRGRPNVAVGVATLG